MNPGADDDAALDDGTERDGTSSPAGAKMIAASSGDGGASEPAQTRRATARIPAPSRRRAGEREDLAPLKARDLDEDVRRGAESVEPQPLRLSRQRERAPADQPRAEERRGLQVGVALWDREAVPRIRDAELREPAVALVTRIARVVAEILTSRRAVAACAAASAEPRDTHAVAGTNPLARAAGDERRRSGARARAGASGGAVPRRRRAGRCGRRPQADTRMSTCPGPGSGAGSSRTARRPRRVSSTIARTPVDLQGGDLSVGLVHRPRGLPTGGRADLPALVAVRRPRG